MTTNLNGPSLANFNSGGAAQRDELPPIPAGAPMIGRLASFAAARVVHELVMRCRLCGTLITDPGGDSARVHAGVRAHWAAVHAEALAALTAPQPPTARRAAPLETPRAAPSPRPAKPAPRRAPDPVVQPAKVVAAVKKPAPATTGPDRRTRLCVGPGCITRFDCTGTMHAKRFCSPACRTAHEAANRPPPATPVCGRDGCNRTFTVSRSHRRYCSTTCYELAENVGAKRNRCPAPCEGPACDVVVDPGSGRGAIRRFCSERCRTAAGRARARLSSSSAARAADADRQITEHLAQGGGAPP